MRRSSVRFVAVAALVALALAACSSSSKGASPATTLTTAGSATPTTAGSSAPTPGAGPTVSIIELLGVGKLKLLVDSKGLTLYISDGDTTAGKSSCAVGCANIWPPVAVTGTPTYGPGVTASMFSVITRADGTKQLAVNGKPLYTFIGDTKLRDVKGEDVSGFYAVLSNGKKWVYVPS